MPEEDPPVAQVSDKPTAPATADAAEATIWEPSSDDPSKNAVASTASLERRTRRAEWIAEAKDVDLKTAAAALQRAGEERGVLLTHIENLTRQLDSIAELEDKADRAMQAATDAATKLQRLQSELKLQQDLGHAFRMRAEEAEAEVDVLRQTSGNLQPGLEQDFGPSLPTQAEVIRLRAEIRAICASTSWRISRPLRAIRRPLRSLHKLIGQHAPDD